MQEHEPRKDRSTPQDDKISFRMLTMADSTLLDENLNLIKVKDKNDKSISVLLHIDSYLASNGAKVYVEAIKLVSPTFASQYLQNILRTTKIIERVPRTDDKGTAFGERILALAPDPGHQNKLAIAVIRTNGTLFQEICSDSLEATLGMERYMDTLHADDTRH